MSAPVGQTKAAGGATHLSWLQLQIVARQPQSLQMLAAGSMVQPLDLQPAGQAPRGLQLKLRLQALQGQAQAFQYRQAQLYLLDGGDEQGWQQQEKEIPPALADRETHRQAGKTPVER
ncbi:hypothetical protein [Thiohalobacter thiocyanaticus]|uniref:hypothetical protein n=1 Tax=Thiohalobacter thiocyanaticus TaxID=585455 RepID=UPI000F63D457|nr:hypothetical protein [Thiohalobacter thiocyanaticus]